MSNYKQIYIPQGGNLDTTQSNKNNGSDNSDKNNSDKKKKKREHRGRCTWEPEVYMRLETSISEVKYKAKKRIFREKIFMSYKWETILKTRHQKNKSYGLKLMRTSK